MRTIGFFFVSLTNDENTVRDEANLIATGTLSIVQFNAPIRLRSLFPTTSYFCTLPNHDGKCK